MTGCLRSSRSRDDRRLRGDDETVSRGHAVVRIVYFTHSLQSCWNHGNAHFLRGVTRALVTLGHDVTVFEPAESWSRANLMQEDDVAAASSFATSFPDLAARSHFLDNDLGAMVEGADVVIVHEWNELDLVAAIGAWRRGVGQFCLLFHDTHHRMVSEPDAMAHFDLSGYDGVLAFGETLSAAYRVQGWGDRVFTWHEGADTTLFHPPNTETTRTGAVWIGNWGDGERSKELQNYALDPVSRLGLPLDVYGVRYPAAAIEALDACGARYHGWIANADAPAVFARHVLTLHVPRRFYVTHLPGIPTIRVFEALACGIPLVSAPWRDVETLFSPGADFLLADAPSQMEAHLRAVMHDAALRDSLAAHGLETIRTRHSCNLRAQQLLTIIAQLRDADPEEAV
jgi:spore maturation protein CgeB